MPALQSGQCVTALTAIEIALWDLAHKARGLPAHVAAAIPNLQGFNPYSGKAGLGMEMNE